MTLSIHSLTFCNRKFQNPKLSEKKKKKEKGVKKVKKKRETK